MRTLVTTHNESRVSRRGELQNWHGKAKQRVMFEYNEKSEMGG